MTSNCDDPMSWRMRLATADRPPPFQAAAPAPAQPAGPGGIVGAGVTGCRQVVFLAAGQRGGLAGCAEPDQELERPVTADVNGHQLKTCWRTTATTASFPEAVPGNEEVVPVNVSTWVLPSGVTVGR
jgi:hypothetical protein